jgi:histidyl-tRNA synthetase
VSLYPEDIEKPFKRYQVGKVWRGEKPQAGRFREFIQFDADIVGTTRTSADAEVISLIYETLKALGFTKFIIRVNNRKILNGLPQFAGYDPAANADVLRVIDKLDKISWEGVSGELSDLSLGQPQLEKIKQFLDLQSLVSKDALSRLSELMSASTEAVEGIKELNDISSSVKALGVPDEFWTVDLSVARGLGYYTGPVFETTLLDIPEIGSVFSGGRYDGLVSRFSAQNLPATGASIGVDRLFSAMEKLGIVKREQGIARVIVLNFDPNGEEYCQRIVAMLRASGIPTEFYLGKEKTIKGQLAYAVKREFGVVIIAGGSEQSKSTAQVKDMIARTQQEFGLDSLLSAVKGVLSK